MFVWKGGGEGGGNVFLGRGMADTFWGVSGCRLLDSIPLLDRWGKRFQCWGLSELRCDDN